jgi:hypothetical protein
MVGDSERHYAILKAAMQCRCVLVLDAPPDAPPRVLLVSHGRVLSVRDAHDIGPDQVAAWVRVHEPVIQSAQLDQSELDAAHVLQSWLRCNRAHVRWVAIPLQPAEDDLIDRVLYVLGTPAPEPL